MQEAFELEYNSKTITTLEQLREILPLRGNDKPNNIKDYLEAAILEGSITACNLIVHYMWQTTVDKEDYVSDMFLLTYTISKHGLLPCVNYLVTVVKFTPIECSGLLFAAHNDKDLTAAWTLYKSFSKQVRSQLPDNVRLQECLKWMNTAPRPSVQL